jgi:hypothetical protein
VGDGGDTPCWWLLVRRHRGTGELAFYRCYSPEPVQRWTVFAMLAHALPAVIAANEHNARPAPAGLIALTCNEIVRLPTALVVEPARVLACPHAWSTWRWERAGRSAAVRFCCWWARRATRCC